MTVHPIRVLLIDNHPLVLDGLRAVLETYEHLAVVGTALSAMAGLSRCASAPAIVTLVQRRQPAVGAKLDC